jgi:hypothetical protein
MVDGRFAEDGTAAGCAGDWRQRLVASGKSTDPGAEYCREEVIFKFCVCPQAPLRGVCYFGKMAGSGRCCRLKQPDARQAGSDRRGHELQVAMKKLGSIEADQQARLAHMLTRKGGKEITKTRIRSFRAINGL